MSIRILILCTGNSCRSQMAEGLLRSYDPSLEVYSAGTHPAFFVQPPAIEVMRERGIDIRNAVSKSVGQFLGQDFDYVITVCDHARETCPVFIGRVRHRIHLGFEDPSNVAGAPEAQREAYRQTRDAMDETFRKFYEEEIKRASA